MKTLFVSADIHGFYTEYERALKRAHFDIKNPDHIIVICGDLFDRGKEPIELWDFIKSIPVERRILIRGNHEHLFKAMVDRGYSEPHDEHNGTLGTLHDINNFDIEDARHRYYTKLLDVDFNSQEYYNLRDEFNKQCRTPFHSEKTEELIDWFNSDEFKNYFELDNYIFVHSWIPVGQLYEWNQLGYRKAIGSPWYREDWRNATDWEWEDATWGCPWQQALNGLNKTGKMIVCGHWHTSDFFNHLSLGKMKRKKNLYDCPIFTSKKYGLIGLDACTAGSHKVNVLKIEISDEEWEKWHG